MSLNPLAPHQELQVLMEGYWGRLSPVHQSTSNADTLLGNVFEPLIDLSPQGGIVPGVAQHWDISDDDRLYRFHLRPNARFSDGTPLTAEIYRRALLQSVVSLDRDSHNPNALDVLYRIKGFSLKAAESDKVEGLRVESDGTLVLEFSASFRTALAELTGTRYAAWILDGKTGNYLGTGPYKIVRHIDNKEVDYEPNPYSWRPAAYQRVVVKEAPQGLIDLCEGKGQVYVGRASKTKEIEKACSGSRKIEFQGGAISSHSSIAVNGLPGKLFSNSQFRLAIQYAIHLFSRQVLEKYADLRRLTADNQFYPPLWPGRLPDAEAEHLIALGQPFVADLAAASQKKPIELLCSTPILKELQTDLESLGLRFAHPYRVDEVKVIIEAAYGKRDYDLNFAGAMVVGSDPDGLYHLLGKNGALTSPATARPGVHAALEAGRGALRDHDLQALYSEVSRKILEEVPEIHLAFGRNGAFFDGDKVIIKTKGMNSDRFQFDSFLLR